MRAQWIGVVEVLTEPSELSGDTRAFTNVVTWAEGVDTFRDRVEYVFSKYGWSVLETTNVRQVSDATSYAEDIADMIAMAMNNPNACMFSTFHYYPSPPA